MRLPERRGDRPGRDHARRGSERDPEPDPETAASPARRHGESHEDDRKSSNCRQREREQTGAEADQDDGTDADEPCGADGHDGSGDAGRARRFPVERESRATADSGRGRRVDERADPVACDRPSSRHLVAARCETRLPRAAATRESGSEGCSRDREEGRICTSRMREPFVDGRDQVAQHDLSGHFVAQLGFPERQLASTPSGHRIGMVTRRPTLEVRSRA